MTGVQEWVRQTVRVCRAPRGGTSCSLSYPELSLSLEQLSHHRALEQRANTGRGLHQLLSQPALGPPALCLVGNRRISSKRKFSFRGRGRGRGWGGGGKRQKWTASPKETAIPGTNPSSQFLRIQSPHKHRILFIS